MFKNKTNQYYTTEAKQFFKQAHRYLTQKYGTRENHLSFKKLHHLRYYVLAKKYSRKAYIELVRDKIKHYSRSPESKKNYWFANLYKFLIECDDACWKEITTPTPYDISSNKAEAVF